MVKGSRYLSIEVPRIVYMSVKYITKEKKMGVEEREMRRKGRRIVILVAVLVLALSVGAFGFQNEPEGFRGLKWGIQ